MNPDTDQERTTTMIDEQEEQEEEERCIDCGYTPEEGACIYCKMD